MSNRPQQAAVIQAAKQRRIDGILVWKLDGWSRDLGALITSIHDRLSAAEVADFLEITSRTVFNIQKNYEDGGLEKALYDDPRPGTPARFDDRVKARIVAVVVTETRSGAEFAKFLASIERKYSDAKKIILVMDNLNTHREKSLLDFYDEEQGHAIWSRFEVHYTPIHGSWLNQAEIAINMYSRQSLGRTRIPDLESLKKRTKAWVNYINAKKVIINWQFTQADAREKFDYM